jgi:septal ring factor EnvC (AmiA/AmiB activator)
VRGRAAEVGDVRVAKNGYHYTRTEKCWRLTHHIIMEKKLGRPLEPDERVVFVDGKRTNQTPTNLEVREKGRGSLHRRRAQLQARVEELQAEISEIDRELAKV